MDKGPGFAGSSTSDDQEGGIAECDGARLIRVEGGGELLLVARGEIPLPRTVEARLVGHGG
jgi:hypothetical protein